MNPSSAYVAVKLFGIDLAFLNEKANEVAEILRHISGSSDVFAKQNTGMQFLQVTIDKLAAGRLGLDSDSIETLLRAQIEGLNLGIVQEGIKRTPLILRGNSDTSNFENLQITLPNGGHVPVTAIAKIEKVEGVVSVGRERGQRFVVIRSNVQDRDLVGFVDEARKAVAEKVKLPTGYTVEFGGQFENQQRAAATLSLVVPISLGLIFFATVFNLWFSTSGRAGVIKHSAGNGRRRFRAVGFRRIFIRACIRWFHCLARDRGTEWCGDGQLF